MTLCRILFHFIYIWGIIVFLLFWLECVEIKFPLTKLYRYECAVNIEDLIKLSDVMTEHSLGPNGGERACILVNIAFDECSLMNLCVKLILLKEEE